MGVRRRGWGGGFEALSNYLGDQASLVQRYILQNEERKQQRSFDLSKLATQETDPAQMERLIGMGKQYGLDLSSMRQTPDQLLSSTFNKIGATNNESDLSVNSLLDAVKAYNRPDVLVQAIQRIPQAVEQRTGQIAQRDFGEVQQKGAVARATSEANKTGELAATNANFPMELAQKGQLGQQANTQALDLERQKNPILISRAGGEEGARERAGLAPDIITGKAELAGKEASAREAAKLPTETERRTGDYYSEALNANNLSMQLEGKGAGGLMAAVPGALQSNLNKQYNQAKGQFIDAVIRPRTGAAVGKEEMAKYEQMFFRQTGDDPTTVAQKQQARIQAMEGLRYQAGKGAKILGPDIQLKPGTTLDKILNGTKAPFEP